MDINGILAVSKAIIAAAWSDSQLTAEEVESLKDLVYRFSNLFPSPVGISARQWAELEIYIDSPVSDAERERLLEELKATPLSAQDKAEVRAALEDLIESDGTISDSERQVFDQISYDLEHMHAGLFGQMGRVMKVAVSRRSQSVRRAPNREAYLDEFIENRIYYRLHQRGGIDRERLGATSYDLRKLCAAGGMMARVARIDQEVSEAEFDVMVAALQPSGLELDTEEAAIIAEIAVSEVAADLDLSRLIRDFFSRTTPAERRAFLSVLFAVAAADQGISAEEEREIESLAYSLNIERREVLSVRAGFD